MDIRYIQEFLTLFERGNYSKAAEELIMSQPTLTKHIQSLEREVGGKLFDRSTREMTLSPLGEIFLPYARRMNQEYEKLEASMLAFTREKNASFTIGVVRNLQFYDVVGHIAEFKKRYPDCIINIVEVEEYKLKSMLLEGKLNLISAAFPVGSASPTALGTGFIPIGEGNIVAVLPDTFSPIPDYLSIEEAVKYPLIIPERTSPFSRIIRNAIRNTGENPEIIYEGSAAGCLDFTRAGMGISLQAREVVNGHGYPDMHAVDILPPLSYTFGLLHRNEAQLTHWEKLFVGFVRTYKPE